MEIADALQGTLRPYQHEGLSWLRLLTKLGLGACLADDMGLGKTIQVLALLLGENRDGAARPGVPSILVVPASLLGNWRDEASHSAPSLKLRFLHPAETDRQTLAAIEAAPATHLADTDLVVTTYAMLVRQSWLAEVSWRLVILDEAQAVRSCNDCDVVRNSCDAPRSVFRFAFAVPRRGRSAVGALPAPQLCERRHCSGSGF